ncbi:hypothetical protein O1611_g641 [Lasiodiplodia mahajangana]|uniref:Uncharacterized protein n=1 Tax=Lasiodiplodia mahajangana TaxID=1108764 RepID=A0ACC2JZM5_9PEZI|nr:hypothetical protein O1611_g641 [Lasiodiplodia mahajangana]
MSRGKTTSQILRLTLARQATREIRPLTTTQLYRFQSSSSTVGSAIMANNNNATVKFSAGTDETALTAALEELLSSAGKGGRWALISSGQGLERSFKFKTFTKTWVISPMLHTAQRNYLATPGWDGMYRMPGWPPSGKNPPGDMPNKAACCETPTPRDDTEQFISLEVPPTRDMAPATIYY